MSCYFLAVRRGWVMGLVGVWSGRRPVLGARTTPQEGKARKATEERRYTGPQGPERRETGRQGPAGPTHPSPPSRGAHLRPHASCDLL
ncbi:hypothetical protein BHE74_00004402 [Ensete ventricosum]|nr:hypothetical protein BHE74_00004402 [Ensete ventricosum]